MRTCSRAIVIKDNQLLVMDRNKFGQKYLSLPGGEIDLNEGPPAAAIREVAEESTITINNPRLVIIEEAGEIYGRQCIYLCEFVSGEPKLAPDSIESQINRGGKNLYQPKWLDLSQLAGSNLLPHELKDTILKFLSDGFPDQPISLNVAKDSKV